MTTPKEHHRDHPCHHLTLSIELGENFLKQVISYGGVNIWNDLQRRLAPLVGQVWSDGEDAPAVSIFFTMPKRVKSEFPDANLEYAYFTDEVEVPLDIPNHMTITKMPTRSMPAEEAIVELLLDGDM